MANSSFIRTISFCSGFAGLDLGFDAACEYLGIAARTVAYVEWEAYAASLLLARMEDKALAPAPVWCGDLGRLDGREFRGRIDALLAGFPCQPHSVAGSRKGIADERWIWDDIARFVRDSGVGIVVLENVPGLLTSGGFGPVLASLAEMGFAAEWGVLSAASVGASHERERVFIVAALGYAKHHERSAELWQQSKSANSRAGESSESVAYRRCEQQHLQHWRARDESAGSSSELADVPRLRRGEGRPESSRQQGRSDAAECSSELAQPHRPNREGGAAR